MAQTEFHKLVELAQLHCLPATVVFSTFESGGSMLVVERGVITAGGGLVDGILCPSIVAKKQSILTLPAIVWWMLACPANTIIV